VISDQKDLANARLNPAGEPLTPAPPLSASKRIHSSQDRAAEPTLSRGERVVPALLSVLRPCLAVRPPSASSEQMVARVALPAMPRRDPVPYRSRAQANANGSLRRRPAHPVGRQNDTWIATTTPTWQRRRGHPLPAGEGRLRSAILTTVNPLRRTQRRSRGEGLSREKKRPAGDLCADGSRASLPSARHASSDQRPATSEQRPSGQHQAGRL
jgi:hypothetical protein